MTYPTGDKEATNKGYTTMCSPFIFGKTQTVYIHDREIVNHKKERPFKNSNQKLREQ